MVTSALVVTFDGLASEPRLRSAFVELGEDPRQLTCGEPQGAHLPVVITSEAPRASADLLRKLETLPGVHKVDVVAIDFCSELDLESSEEEA